MRNFLLSGGEVNYMKHTLDSFVIKNSKIKIKMEKKIGKEKKKE